MKIRNGFVSNSSSSSFCLYGAQESPDILFNLILEKFPKETEQFKIDSEEDDEYEAREEVIEFLMEKFHLIDPRFSYVIDNDGNYVMIGIDPMDIKDDETGLQFKNTVWNGLYELLNIESKDCDMVLGEIYG